VWIVHPQNAMCLLDALRNNLVSEQQMILRVNTALVQGVFRQEQTIRFVMMVSPEKLERLNVSTPEAKPTIQHAPLPQHTSVLLPPPPHATTAAVAPVAATSSAAAATAAVAPVAATSSATAATAAVAPVAATSSAAATTAAVAPVAATSSAAAPTAAPDFVRTITPVETLNFANLVWQAESSGDLQTRLQQVFKDLESAALASLAAFSDNNRQPQPTSNALNTN
jgi:hypothetical protein